MERLGVCMAESLGKELDVHKSLSIFWHAKLTELQPRNINSGRITGIHHKGGHVKKPSIFAWNEAWPEAGIKFQKCERYMVIQPSIIPIKLDQLTILRLRKEAEKKFG